MAQKIEDVSSEKAALLDRDIALAYVEVGNKEQGLATLEHALELSQKIENAREKDFALRVFAPALAEAGEIKRAVEVAQKITNVREKAEALLAIALTLSTEEVSKKTKQDLDRRFTSRMKKTFTTAEKQIAKQIVEAMGGS